MLEPFPCLYETVRKLTKWKHNFVFDMLSCDSDFLLFVWKNAPENIVVTCINLDATFNLLP